MTTSKTPTSPSSRDLQPYLSGIESFAQRLAATPAARTAGAEYDDLVQEGMLAAYIALRKGVDPTPSVGVRMKDWIRLQKRQREGDPIPYETLLPTEVPAGGEG